eukprot:CAMPEP_0197634316 /NCGR_PEP_ID=MMETSP1338-20131121/10440_1 /TAXON_ID=43686 ORGANISM="Pelagodinium beii, Strain RCC1491" /NCGR_SAMPLE_ID=MMETSP1338 /ASSEMBLY_ACC=CAM_ASM_000754 /LENGTH=555 /DNA_ID=CAMNT_0043206155 /DNA_START=15 /DNA_END=1682 /DNA_ORIENTATION=-
MSRLAAVSILATLAWSLYCAACFGAGEDQGSSFVSGAGSAIPNRYGKSAEKQLFSLRRSARGEEDVMTKPSEVVDDSKAQRARDKTAETKVRVAEKAAKKQAESAEGSLPYAEWAAQARQMSAKAGELAAKPGKDSPAERGKELLLGGVASGLDAAAVAPPWAPLAAAVTAGLLGLALFISSMTSGPKPVQQSVPPASQSQVVEVKSAPKELAPSVASAPKAMPTAPQAATSAAAKVAAPAAATLLSPKPAKAQQPEAAPQGIEAARTVASAVSTALKVTADTLPVAEKALEGSLPAVQSAADWVSKVNTDNAADKVAGEVVPLAGQAAGESLKFVLKSGSAALGFAAQGLPVAGEALESATMTIMPQVQNATHGAADMLRGAAQQAAAAENQSSNEAMSVVIRNSPLVAEGAAKALDAFADFLPAAEKVVSYGGKAVTPILQAGLGASSRLASDAANMPMPSMGASEKQQLASTLKELAKDAGSLGQELKEKANSVPAVKQVLTQASQQLEKVSPAPAPAMKQAVTQSSLPVEKVNSVSAVKQALTEGGLEVIS